MSPALRSSLRVSTLATILLVVVLAAGCAPDAGPEVTADQAFVSEFVTTLIGPELH